MAEVRVKEREGSRGTALERRGGGFDPFHRMQQVMQDMFRPWGWLESPFGFGFEQRGGGEKLYVPAFDVKERNDAYCIEADLPGVKESDLDISLTGNRLTISGKREATKKDENEQYYSYEREYGSFLRTFNLPDDVNAEHVSADFDNGVLSVVIPKKEAVKPRKISLKEKIKALKS